MPLFKLDKNHQATQIRRVNLSKEKDIQTFCEKNLETLFHIRLIASEFSTGTQHGGRIDSLGLDENKCPVILEYKKKGSQTVVTQGFFYLDWLMDHRGDFQVAVQKALNKTVEIDWSNPRLILVAESFSKYDTHAVNKMGQNVELKVYRFYQDNLLYFEDMLTPQDDIGVDEPKPAKKPTAESHWTLEYHLEGKPQETRHLLEEVREAILALNAETPIVESPAKQYIAYKNGRNFCEIVVQANGLKIYLDLALAELQDPNKLAEDCTGVGHWATGDCRFNLSPGDDLEYALSLIAQSYNRTL